MTVMDGKEVSAALKKSIAGEVEKMVAAGYRRPRLVAVLVGDDGASQVYVGRKEQACKEVGFDSEVIRLAADTSQEQLDRVIDRLNADDATDGFIVQLPLPAHLSEEAVIERISPSKDVDGFHPETTGRMISGLDSYLPATPAGILELIKYYDIPTAGKHCVVIGRSNIVGRPIANLLSMKGYPGDCTVTLCHSRTANLADIARSADILIAALGAPHFVTADMGKEGAGVIDVGITRVS
ncbi:MAG: bifunctional 5,10-methylenetetrahydrofolate dehydrogenase/5,10-methenyltetrahydrofolate cyclohydrolase, partial [Rikenellaceae bacterium]|nr:bifunctional 5,10-methylenetetrahydrofolate dehydrogenase/5,10-methenyltetrahydrofolate cyclohydrolase [Rikenellaceae bacterium]